MNLKYRLCGQRPLPVGFGGGQYKYDRKVLYYMTTDDSDSCVDFWTVRSLPLMTALPTWLTTKKCTGFQLARKAGADMRGRDELVGKSILLVQLHH